MSTPFYDLASLVVVPSGYKSGKIYAQKPLTTDGQLTFTRASTATRVNASGLIETVSSGVPRLDYTNSSCPKILLEPQRSNTITHSQDINNCFSSKVGVTVTSDATTSPDGTANADLLKFDTTSGYVLRGQTVAAATTYTMSVFVKNNNFTSGQNLTFNMSDGVIGGLTAQINVVAKTATYSAAAGAYTNVSGKVEDYGNGWFRVSVTGTSVNGGGGWYEMAASGITNSVYVWGFSLEIGAYATSYIPTLGTSVTRVADAAYKTGISSLIGQTEGVIFIDFVASAQAQDGAGYSCITIFGNGTQNFQIYTNPATTLRWYAFSSGALIDQTANETLVAGQRYKIAYAYKSGDYALYINGVQKRTYTGSVVPAVSQFNFNTDAFGAGNAKVENKFNQVLVFKTRLTNAQLAELTTL